MKRIWPFSRKSAACDTQSLLNQMLLSAGSKAGVPINHRTALQCTTALSCARVISEGLAQVPFKLHRSLPGGGSEVARDESLHRLLSLRPNEFQTSFEFREMLGLHLVFAGNAYALKTRDRHGRLLELLPLQPNQVAMKRDGWETRYTVSGENGAQYAVDAADIWHLRGPSWNGWSGLDGVRLAREALGLSMAAEEHGARFFSNGAHIPGVLSTTQALDPEQRKALRAAVEEKNSGLRNAFNFLLLWGGLEYKATGVANDAAQLLETRAFQVTETCRAFRVLPIMVGHADKAQTYASSEQMFLAHVTHTMMPWFARIEQSATVNLLSEREQAQGLYFKFNANGLLRSTARDRAEYFRTLYNVGALNPNQIRSIEDMNPYDGGEKYRVPLNMVDPALDETPTKPEGAA